MKNAALPSAGFVLLLLVPGCSGASFASGSGPSPAIANASSAVVRQNASGGAFSAKYSGEYSFANCASFVYGHMKFRGFGRALYLHASTESGEMTSFYNEFGCVWSGRVRLTASRGPKDFVTFNIGLSDHDPCNTPVSFAVHHGTGKFANARGRGTVTFSCTSSGYSDVWSGTLTF